MEIHQQIIASIAGDAATVDALAVKLREVDATSTDRDLLIYVRMLLKLLESPMLGDKVSMTEVRRSEKCAQLLRYCERQAG